MTDAAVNAIYELSMQSKGMDMYNLYINLRLWICGCTYIPTNEPPESSRRQEVDMRQFVHWVAINIVRRCAKLLIF